MKWNVEKSKLRNLLNKMNSGKDVDPYHIILLLLGELDTAQALLCDLVGDSRERYEKDDHTVLIGLNVLDKVAEYLTHCELYYHYAEEGHGINWEDIGL